MILCDDRLYISKSYKILFCSVLLLRCSMYTEIRRDLLGHVRKCCPRIDLLNAENKFMYLLNSSGSAIKDVARFFIQHIKHVQHR